MRSTVPSLSFQLEFPTSGNKLVCSILEKEVPDTSLFSRIMPQKSLYKCWSQEHVDVDFVKRKWLQNFNFCTWNKSGWKLKKWC